MAKSSAESSSRPMELSMERKTTGARRAISSAERAWPPEETNPMALRYGDMKEYKDSKRGE